MTDDEGSTPLGTTRRGYVVIDQADEIDVTSYDSFPASDPPSWTATGIGPPHDAEPQPRPLPGDPAPSSGGRHDREDLS